MIRVRLSSLSDYSGDHKIKIIKDEILTDAVNRSLDSLPKDIDKPSTFQVLVNGHKIEPHLWQYTRLNKEDNVLIAPLIKGSDEDRYRFGQVLTIAAIAISVSLTAPLGPFYAGLINAGVAIASGLVFSQMFPPPVTKSDGSESPLDRSQMYSFTNQSNSVNKYGYVPKVYGTHRIFPTIAANPYTELEADSKGNVAQYLYCIYDLGLGPVEVSDIKIGDTPIVNYSDYSLRLVDPNKPAINEGPWDEATFNTFEYYKGDVESDSASVSLNSNQVSGGPLSEYRVVRNSATSNTGQEITLNFVCGSGLVSYSSTGAAGYATIILDVEFAKDGTDDWRAYNDSAYVHSYKETGGDDITQTINFGITTDTTYLSEIQNPKVYETYLGINEVSGYDYIWVREEFWGIPTGSSYLVVSPSSELLPGVILKKNGIVIGTVSSVVTSGYGGNYRVNLVSPTTQPLYVLKLRKEYTDRWTAAYVKNRNFEVTPTEVDNILTYNKLILKKFRIRNKSADAVYSSLKFTPKEIGVFKVRVTRVSTAKEYSTSGQDSLTWVNLITRKDSLPIQTTKRHTFIELKIKATGQLNGSIQNLSAICTSVLNVWDGSSWAKAPTNNPAWVYTDILTGEVNKRPISVSRLDLVSIKEWADYCDEIPPDAPFMNYLKPRFESNFILDFSTTLQDLVHKVTSAAQASMNLVDGKYGVLLDTAKTVPVQIFTPRNSKNFSSTRIYSKKPHALRVRYVDPSADWQEGERVVYDVGYDLNTATEFDDIQTFGCTNHEQAWRFGRYSLFQNRLRQEVMTLEVDFEHLVCTRGDFVQITQDSMKVGGSPARVKTVVGNTVTIDDGLEISGLLSYGYVFRSKTGEIYQNTLTTVSADTFTLDGTTMPQAGDLIIIGEVGRVVYDCLVKSISPNNDLTATITLIEKADSVYTYETATTLPDYSPQLSNTVNAEFLPPGEVTDLEVIANTWRFTGAAYEYYITLDWDVPTGSAAEVYEVYADNGRGYNLVDTTRESLYEYIADSKYLGVEHTFKVLAVSSTGNKLDLGAVGFVTATPLRKTTRPSNVESLNIDITGEVLQLVWQRISDVDTKEYLIRYSPLTSGTWETTIPLMRVDRNTSLAATQARTGTYLIKAIDFNDNESQTATAAITTIPELFGLNVISTITDFPTLGGSFDRAENNGGALILDKKVVGGVETSEYYSEGYYYYADLLDLGEIYTVRLQSLIQAEGFTAEDMMSNWTSLDLVTAMSNSSFSEWDVKAQYRGTNVFNSIADWTSLDTVLTMSQGSEDNWTEWRDFVIGDATFRIAQFRLKLISNKTSVSPRVFDGTIKADMPDRIESYNNLTSGAGSYQVNYTPAFKGPGTTPNIQITIDSGASGDYWVFNSKTLTGFNITFYDNTNTIVSRQFDATVKGYGRRTSNVI